MSKIRLPELKLGAVPSNLSWDIPDPAMERWNAGLRAAGGNGDNAIAIYDPIGAFYGPEGVTAKRVAADLRRLDRDVVVNINSPGGDPIEAFAIYSLLRDHPHEVNVRVLGAAISAASIVAMAGDTIQIARPGFLMIHNIMTLVFGNRNDFLAAVEVLEPMDDALAGVYAARTGGDKAEIASMMDKETWLGGEKAVELGFADELLPSDQVEEDEEPAQPAAAARRRVEALLQKAGASRSERRALMKQLAGTPRAAGDTKPGAGVSQTVNVLEQITAEIHAKTLLLS